MGSELCGLIKNLLAQSQGEPECVLRTLRQALQSGSGWRPSSKPQGQEAPVVFFSMATSTGEDVPRDAVFLHSRARLASLSSGVTHGEGWSG